MSDTLNINELKTIVNYIMNNNKVLEETGRPKTSIEIIGESGIGKTSAVLQYCKENDLDCVKLNLTQIEELGDLIGFPVKEFMVVDENGNEEWVQQDVLDSYLGAGHKTVPGQKPRMSYATPEWLPDGSKGGILLLDDWNRADQRFIQAIMELIDRGEYISWSLPKGWTIMLTANPDNGDYNVNSIDNAQRTRFVSLNLDFDHKIWAEWAEAAGIDGRCINFVLMYPEVVKKEAGVQTINARSLVTFFNAISGMDNFQTAENLANILLIASGCFSSKENVVGQLFTTFINNKLDTLIQPDVMLEGDWKEVSKEMRDLVGRQDKGTYRADIAGTLTIRFMNYVMWKLDKKDIDTKALVTRVLEIVNNKDGDLLSMDLIFQLCKKLVANYPQQCQPLLADPKLMKVLLT